MAKDRFELGPKQVGRWRQVGTAKEGERKSEGEKRENLREGEREGMKKGIDFNSHHPPGSCFSLLSSHFQSFLPD